MPFTKCPNCRKVQQIAPILISQVIGCMNARCGASFYAHEYRMHSGLLSRMTFWLVIAFALVLLFRWVWTSAARIVSWIGL